MSLGKVLVVDDEPDVRQLLYDFLSDKGYDVVLAAGGFEAIDVLEQDKPDLVLLGIETLSRIATIDLCIHVIMVTANADIRLISRLLATGAVDYTPKPFDLEYLEQAVSIQLAACQDR